MDIKIVLFWERLLVKKVETETTQSGILLTDSMKENNHFYEVVQKSDKIDSIDVGDIVCIWQWSWDVIKLEWTEYKIIDKGHILWVQHN